MVLGYRARRTVAGVILLALAACHPYTWSGPGKDFEDEVMRGSWPAAAGTYADNQAYFDERRGYFGEDLALVAQGLNAELEPQLDRAIARAKAVDWPVQPDRWNDVKGQLKVADNLIKTYDSYALLQDPALRSTKVQELSTTIYLLNGKMRETAAAAFAEYDHFAGRSFFDAYPLNMKPERFMSAHYNRIKSDVDRANTLELGRFLESYRMGEALQGDVRQHVREAYVDALTLERTGGRAPGLLDAWSVLREVKGKGIDVKRIAQDRFAVLELSSHRRTGEAAIAFPIKVKADLAFTVHQVALEKAMADTAAAKADYLVVVDLAESRTASTDVSRIKVNSRHYSHSVYRDNPSYERARRELELEQDNLNATIRNQRGSGVKIKGGGNEAAIAGLLAHLIGMAVNNSQISSAEERVAAAQERLDATPPQLEEKRYASYTFDRIGREGTKSIAVNYYVLDRKAGQYVKGRFEQTERRTFDILDGVRDSDPDVDLYRDETYRADDVENWLREPAVVKVSDIVMDLRKRQNTAEQLPPFALVQQDLFERRRTAVALAPAVQSAPTVPNGVARDRRPSAYAPVPTAEYRFPEGARRPDAYAVVIGVRNYRNRDVPTVRFAHNDSEAIRQYLIKNRGFPAESVIVLNDPNQSDLLAYFGTDTDAEGKLFNAVTRESMDEVFVYFSGHGVPTDDGGGVLLPSDADPTEPGLTGYKLETLVRNLNGLRDVQVTLVVDSCFSGLSHDGTLVRSASPVFLAARPERLGLSNGVVLTAADGKEIASWDEHLRMGLFTRHYLEGVLGKADRIAGDGDGTVELFEMERFLRTQVGRDANRLYSRQQTPQVVGAPLTVVNAEADPEFDTLEDILALAR